jgi:hypothetical protein
MVLGQRFLLIRQPGDGEMGARLLRAEPRTLFAGPFSSQTNLGATLQTLRNLALARFSFSLCSSAVRAAAELDAKRLIYRTLQALRCLLHISTPAEAVGG